MVVVRVYTSNISIASVAATTISIKNGVSLKPKKKSCRDYIGVIEFSILLTSTYLEFTDSDFIVSLNAVAVRSWSRPAPILITCGLQSGSVSSVSIVSTLCSDGH